MGRPPPGVAQLGEIGVVLPEVKEPVRQIHLGGQLPGGVELRLPRVPDHDVHGDQCGGEV
jgi:hypothetical protein